MGLKHCSSCGAAPLRPPRKHSFSIIFLSYLHHEFYWSVSSFNPNMTCQHLKCQNHAGIATDTRTPMLFRRRSTEKRWNLRVYKLPPALETYDCTTCSQEWASRSLFQHRNETAQNLQWICRTWATVTKNQVAAVENQIQQHVDNRWALLVLTPLQSTWKCWKRKSAPYSILIFWARCWNTSLETTTSIRVRKSPSCRLYASSGCPCGSLCESLNLLLSST